MNRPTRRAFLTGCVAGSIGLTGCTGLIGGPTGETPREGTPPGPDGTPLAEPTDPATGTDAAHRSPTDRPSGSVGTGSPIASQQGSSPPVDVRGAIYLPARAYTVYQMWRDTAPGVIERDLGYAASVNLNAVRTWASYEYWKEDPAALERAVDHFLEAAADEGVGVLLGLFEGTGYPPTRENLVDTDPLTAVGTYEPKMGVVKNPEQWGTPREYVRWFMDRYRDDERLLGIEVMNEPGWNVQQRFARGMYETLVEERGDVPLTVGSTSLANNADYAEWGVDIFQFHYNFANDRAAYRDLLRQAVELQAVAESPVWLTEWQRVRSGHGFASPVQGDEWQPDYSSLAPVIQEFGVDNFFWTLMVQPAYTMAQRKQGVITGLFHGDGAVWSLDDARAIKAMSGDPSFHAEERREWPDWAMAAKRKYRK